MTWVSCVLGVTLLVISVVSKSVENDNRITSHHTHKRSTQCYGELGCFSTGGLFFSLSRPINFLPFVRSAIDTRFYLFTRKNPRTIQTIKAGDANSITSSNFNASRPTKMISHGFLENGKVKWMMDMKDAFLMKGDYNVISIDWGGGSLPPYTQATANTRLVGAEIALLINYLKDNFHAKPETFHILGHSLGAHIAGYAGERVQYVGRITGLDPAGPYYSGTDRVVRLDPTDALFVDILHTNGMSIVELGYGMKQPCGHVDYYPNGGAQQPGCDAGPLTSVLQSGFIEGAKQFVACNHLRSYALFTESINSVCPFEGFRCDSYEHFQDGRCMPCHGGACGYMGFNADKQKPQGGQTHVKYYLKTFANGKFCGYHHQIQLSIGSGGRKERGIPFISLIGQNGHTAEYALTKDNIDIYPATSYKYTILSHSDLGALKQVEMRWKHDAAWYNVLDWNILGLRRPTVSIQKITVLNGESSSQTVFCDMNGPLENDKKKLIYPGTSC